MVQTMVQPGLQVSCDTTTGKFSSFKLYGEEMLNQEQPCKAELLINGLPLKTRLHQPAGAPGRLEHFARMKGEKFVDHFSGAGVVVVRSMGERTNLPVPCFGIHYLLRRELADMDDLPCPGPGGPVIEAPLWVDTFSLLNLNWQFWGDDTRMIHPSTHTQGPADEFGHIGYEHDTPENAKAYLQNVWRRIYPGVMAIHGGVFYNAKTGHWMAITCRRPNVGYILNIQDAGRGVGYDFTLHSHFNIGDSLQMPEIKIYYGQTREEMMTWMADYITYYYEEAPEWAFKTVWGEGLAWNNKPTWTAQGEYWEKCLNEGVLSGIGYSLVTNRPIRSGTTPLGYEPDPNHGTQEEFKRMCRRMADRGVPLLIWMSHSGVVPGAPDIDDDWFIRGIDGRACASWGSVDGGLTHCNPGHPGYIEYTKKWIRFYMKECGAKGIFFDCLGWAFPPDFTPRDFMRYPGDTNRMAIKFMEEIYACIKECDPEGIMLGEGTTIDAPVNIFSIAGNPVRAIDGMGPRDFLLQLNRYAKKRMIIDQGGSMLPASGMCCMDPRAGAEARNRFLVQLLREKGGRDAFTHLVGDLSILDDLLFVPVQGEPPPHTLPCAATGIILLPGEWDTVKTLTEVIDGTTFTRAADGMFHGVTAGIYRMQ